LFDLRRIEAKFVRECKPVDAHEMINAEYDAALAIDGDFRLKPVGNHHLREGAQ